MLSWVEVTIQLLIMEEMMYHVAFQDKYDEKKDALRNLIQSTLKNIESDGTIYKYESVFDILCGDLDSDVDWVSDDSGLRERLFFQSEKAKRIVSSEDEYRVYRSNPLFCSLSSFSQNVEGSLSDYLKQEAKIDEKMGRIYFSPSLGDEKERPFKSFFLQEHERVPFDRMDSLVIDLHTMISSV